MRRNAHPLAPKIATPRAMAFAVEFGLAPHLADLLAKLSDGTPQKAFRTHIYALRRALESEAIDHTSRGYQLTEIGLAECDRAVSDFRAWVTGRAA